MKEVLKMERKQSKQAKEKKVKASKGKMLQKGVAIMMLIVTLASVVLGVLANVL